MYPFGTSRPVVSHPFNRVVAWMASDNPMVSGSATAAPENQQETARAGSSETIRQPSCSVTSEMKRWSEPCGDAGRPAETTGPIIDTMIGNSSERNSLSGKSNLPLERVISPANPANNGEPRTHSSGESRGKSRAPCSLTP